MATGFQQPFFNILVNQGATYSMQLTFTDSSSNPLDVSAWTFQGQIRNTYSTSGTEASFAFGPGSQTNIVLVTISATDTAAITVLPATTYNNPKYTYYTYDIQATKADLTVVRILQGTALISAEVTR